MTPAQRKAKARLSFVELDADEVLHGVSLRVDRETFRIIREYLGTVKFQIGGDLADRRWTVRLTRDHCRALESRINRHYVETGGVEDCEVYPVWAAISTVSHMFEEPV